MTPVSSSTAKATVTPVEKPQVVVHRDKPYERTFGGSWWIARCPFCRAALSRYDEDEESCRRFGEHAFRSGEHTCKQGLAA